MTVTQMALIKQRINCVWKDMIETPESLKAWFDSFKNYDFATVETAVIKYIESKPFKPTPADIIRLIPNRPADPTKEYKRFVPQYETGPDGRQKRVIKCRRCGDTGLITWRDDEERMVGDPCTCEAGLANYGEARRRANVGG